MFFQVLVGDEVVANDDDFFELSLTYELNASPSFTISLPISYIKHFYRRNEIIIHLDNGELIHGTMVNYSVNKKEETVSVTYEHVLYEWSWESVPINVVKKNASVKTLLTEDDDMRFLARKWDIEVYDDSDTIEYEFSRETKRDALLKTIELTPDLHFRVARDKSRRLEVGKFGEHKDFIVSANNLLENMDRTSSSSDIVNRAVLLADKSDGGASSATLREVYNDKSLQDEKFPVIITGNTINTSSKRVSYDYTEYAPNTVDEYAIEDLEGIEREYGDIYEGTFSSNAIQPIQSDGEPITNEDRVKASQMLYAKGVRKLRNSRRTIEHRVKIPDLPTDINVGDMVRLMYKNELGCCEELSFNDWLYIIAISINVQVNGTLEFDLVLRDNVTSLFRTREH